MHDISDLCGILMRCKGFNERKVKSALVHSRKSPKNCCLSVSKFVCQDLSLDYSSELLSL